MPAYIPVAGSSSKRTPKEKFSDRLAVFEFKPDGDKVTLAKDVVMNDGAAHLIGNYFSTYALASTKYPFLDSVRWATQDAVWAMFQAAANNGGYILIPRGQYYIGGQDRIAITQPSTIWRGQGRFNTQIIWDPSIDPPSTTTTASIAASPLAAVTVHVVSTAHYAVGAATLDVGSVADTVNILAVLSATTLSVYGILNTHSSGVTLTQDNVLITLTSLAGGVNGTINNCELGKFCILTAGRNGPAVSGDGGNNRVKVGIDMVDGSGCDLSYINIQLCDTAYGSVSLKTHGRQTLDTKKLELWYAQPYIPSPNPNTTGSEACDNFHHKSWYTIAAPGQIHINIQNIAMSNTYWDGLIMAKGRWGITWNSTLAVGSNNVAIKHWRMEQGKPETGQPTGYAILITHVFQQQGLIIEDGYSACDGNPTTGPNKLNGIIVRNIAGLVIKNYTHAGPTGLTVPLDIDNSIVNPDITTFSSAAGGINTDSLSPSSVFLDSSLISAKTGVEHRGDRSRIQRTDLTSEHPVGVIVNSPLPSGSTSMSVTSSTGFLTGSANILNPDGTTAESVLVSVTNPTTLACSATSQAHPYGTRIVQGNVYAKPSWILEVCNRYGLAPATYPAYGRGAGMFFSDGVMMMAGITGVREHTSLFQGHLDFYVNSGLPLTGQGDPNISSTFAARMTKDGYLGLGTRQPISSLANTPTTVGDGPTYRPTLLSNAAAGATSINVISTLGIVAGGGSFQTGNPERVTVTSAAGNTINFSAPLQYSHNAGDIFCQNLGVGVLPQGISWLYTNIGYAAAIENANASSGSDGLLVKSNWSDAFSWIINGQVQGSTKFGARSDGYVVLNSVPMLFPAASTMINNYALQVAGSTSAGYQLKWAATGVLFGTGSPNGVVIAPVGSEYQQQDATSADTAWWVKGPGGSNTGWVQRNSFATLYLAATNPQINFGLGTTPGYGAITNVASGGIADTNGVGGLSTTSIQWRQSTIGYIACFENTDSSAVARSTLLVKTAAADSNSYAMWIDTGGQGGAFRVDGTGLVRMAKGFQYGTPGTEVVSAGVYSATGSIWTGYLGTTTEQPFHLFFWNNPILRLTDIPDLAGRTGIQRVEIDKLFLPNSATTNPGLAKVAATTGEIGGGSADITNVNYISAGSTTDGDYIQSNAGGMRGRSATNLAVDTQAAFIANVAFKASVVTWIQAEIAAAAGVTIAKHTHIHSGTGSSHAHNTNVPSGAGGSYTSDSQSPGVTIGVDT